MHQRHSCGTHTWAWGFFSIWMFGCFFLKDQYKRVKATMKVLRRLWIPSPPCPSVEPAWQWQGLCGLSNPSEQCALTPLLYRTIKSPKGTVTQPNSRHQTYAEVFQTERPEHNNNMMPWWWEEGGAWWLITPGMGEVWGLWGELLQFSKTKPQLFLLLQVRLGSDSWGARQVGSRSRAHRHHTQVCREWKVLWEWSYGFNVWNMSL